MEVHLTPDLEAKLRRFSEETGRDTDELMQDAMAGYLEQISQVRDTLDRRYDDVENGRVKLIDGDEFFESLKQREAELTKARSLK